MNYILRYTADAVPDTKKVIQVLEDFNIHIIDKGSKMLLINGLSDKVMDDVKEELPEGWLLFQDKQYKVPDTRRKINKLK